jgi:hypothetical protein
MLVRLRQLYRSGILLCHIISYHTIRFDFDFVVSGLVGPESLLLLFQYVSVTDQRVCIHVITTTRSHTRNMGALQTIIGT